MKQKQLQVKQRSFTVSSCREAWLLADSLFPTDYERSYDAEKNAGYPIYVSTAQGVNAWISDLCTGLELNMPDGSTVRIHIVEPPAWEYDGQY